MAANDLRILIKQVHSRRFANAKDAAVALRRIAEKSGVADENRRDNPIIGPGHERAAHVVSGCVLLEHAVGHSDRGVGRVQAAAREKDGIVAKDDVVQVQRTGFVGVKAATPVGVVVFDDDVLNGGLGAIGEQDASATVRCATAEAGVAPADVAAAEREARDDSAAVDGRPGHR